MHHERLVAAAVFADVFEAEALRKVEIELHRGQLPGPPDGVNQLHVNLRAIKDRFSFHAPEGDLHPIYRVHQSALGTFPVLHGAGVALRLGRVACGEFDFEAVEAKGAQYGEGEVHTGGDFTLDLVRGSEDVRVVLSETAHAQQPVEHARALV